MSVSGVQGEERLDYTRAESREIRRRSMRLLGSLLRPQRSRLWLTALAVVLSSAAQAAGPAIIAYGIDSGIPALLEQDWFPAGLSVLAYLATGVVGAFLISVYIRQSARVSQAVLIDLRTRVFLHTQRLSLEFHESYTSGRIISRQTSDLDAIRELLDEGLVVLVRSFTYMAFTALALVLLDPLSGLVLLGALIPMTLATRWFQVRSQALFRRSRVASASLIVKFVETMTGIRAVQAFRTEQRNAREFGDLVEDYRDVNARVLGLFTVFNPALAFIGAVSVAATIVLGGFRVVEGSLAIGALLAAVLYVKRFFDPMEDIAVFYNGYQSASSALEKISGVLEERPGVPDPTHPVDLWEAKGHVRFENVEFAYTPDRVILPRFDLDLPAGQTIALVGSTGAGKTTLAKLIARFYDPSDGVLELDGVDLRALHPKDLRRAIVMVTQEAYLFSGSVADNIALGKPDASFGEIVAAAKAVGAHEFIEGLPNGYDTDVNKRGGRVSAGQRQLISFARAFLANPAVLILDEATSSLDIPSERLVQEGLQSLLADRTAIIIAHRLSTVAIADRVLVMEHGRIVEDGSPADLIGGDGRFAALHAAWRDSLV
ncbi:ATP-binding cassette, subfamily B [Agromyces sp. CF514]|uniref:ABC transporter ATP-binding protein n=1 Tax=Agromyces sp. CF514 TaxID=1881031 RepID=UPI0008E443D6|nr:ABC transporter ATP-binding protein [Agromyces sp. CF514]SFR72559.1 ATP-binding cassette, subfamily B [Agromyces sp. CF514]